MERQGNEVQFECPTCQKCFRTGRGLACHRTKVHINKNRRRPENPASSELQIVIRPADQSNVVVAPSVHRCPVCHREWHSKRALNGHMRKHRNRPSAGTLPVAGLLEGTNEIMPAGEAMEMTELEVDVAQCLLALAMTTGVGKAASKHKKAAGLDSAATASSSKATGAQKKLYVCNLCGKRYKSHCAFGGHRSHHRIRTHVEDQIPAAAEVPSRENDMQMVVYAFDLNELHT